jgi:ABC-2 type transport system ATP-binding protein
MIEARSIDYRFGPRAVLQGVDLAVRPGEIHGLLGPQTAGKTTLLRVLSGALAPSGGFMRLAPHTVLIAEDDPAGASPIEARLEPSTRRRIALARALAAEPDVLLLDEPLAGFDRETAAAVRALVKRHAAHGGSVVWATRRLDELHGLASGVTLLAAGRVRYSGSVEALMLRALAQSAEDVADSLYRAA